MPIAVVCAGRLREKYWQDAAAEYVKRMSRYNRLEIVEVPDQPEGPQAMKKESEDMLRHIRPDDHVVALCIDGKSYDSPAFAEKMAAWSMDGRRLVLVIGGSLGLSQAVIDRADERLSFSKFTFPHQLMRVILLEQIYRSFRIMNHEPYHK